LDVISHIERNQPYKALGMIYINMGSVMQLNMLHCIHFFTGKYTAWRYPSEVELRRKSSSEV